MLLSPAQAAEIGDRHGALDDGGVVVKRLTKQDLERISKALEADHPLSNADGRLLRDEYVRQKGFVIRAENLKRAEVALEANRAEFARSFDVVACTCVFDPQPTCYVHPEDDYSARFHKRDEKS